MIEINNLNVLYNNSIRALDNVSIKIEQQKCIAIVGENGSGKSTLLSSLLGLVETQGEIKINGVMLSKETLIQIREVAGLVFQNPDHMIFLPTVRDNLAFGLINQKLDKIEIDKRIAEFAKLFKIEDLLDRWFFSVGFIPAAGSSNIRSMGSLASARAISNIRCSP